MYAIASIKEDYLGYVGWYRVSKLSLTSDSDVCKDHDCVFSAQSMIPGQLESFKMCTHIGKARFQGLKMTSTTALFADIPVVSGTSSAMTAQYEASPASTNGLESIPIKLLKHTYICLVYL